MLYKLVFFFNPNIKELVGFQMTCLEKMYDYNQTRPSQMEKRAELIKEMFAEVGEGCYIEPPFYANWGGRHVHLGNHVYRLPLSGRLSDKLKRPAGIYLMSINFSCTFAGTLISPNFQKILYM